MIPYLLGFEPAHSVVVVALEGPRRRFGPLLRVDLDEPDSAADLVDYLVGVVEAHGFDDALLAAYSTRRDVADAVLPPLIDGLADIGVAVHDGLLTDGQRWWSYTCDVDGCCPPEGRPFDPLGSPLAAHAVFAGLTKADSRDALRSQFSPEPSGVRDEIGARVARIRDDAGEHGDGAWQTTPAAQMRELVAMRMGSTLDRADIARLLALAQVIAARDAAWWSMNRSDAHLHFQLWRQIMRAAPDDLLAPAGALCAFAAWLAGLGALASHAVHRVGEVAPGYSMAELVREALDRSLNPATWDSRPPAYDAAR